jgi:hypothetical protein
MDKLTLCVAVTLLAFGSPATHAQKTISSVVMGNADLVLTKDEVSRYHGEALDGSAEAATKLANYYGFVVLNFEKELYWLQIAAENGDIKAMYSYWVIASQDEDADVRRRGTFWLKRAASLGDLRSRDALHDAPRP